MAKSSERLQAAKPESQLSSRATRLVSALSVVVTLVAAAYAAELHLKIGLYFFAEQALALILGLCLAIIFLSNPAKRSAQGVMVSWYDLVLAILGLISGGYIAIRYPILAEQFFYRPVETFAVSIVLIPLIFEALRRIKYRPQAE